MSAAVETLDVLPTEEARRPNQWTALGALFWLTLRQHARARRLAVLGILFTLPAAIALLARYANQPPAEAGELEFALIFNFIPHALIPLVALLYASGMVQDEVEEQTLTYLLVRPMPRWAVYLTKLAATVLVTVVLAGLFTAITYLAIHAGGTEGAGAVAGHALRAAGLMGLALLAYCALFGWLGLVVRRSLVMGLGYIIVFEGILANIPFVVRQATVMYYFRVLAERWAGVDATEWAIDLNIAPASWLCVAIILGVSMIATGGAASVFARQEFRMKTPEGG